MARNQGPPTDDPFLRRAPAGRDAFADDALPPDEDEMEEEPKFRRAGKRVPVRRGALPRKTAARLRVALGWLLALLGAGGLAYLGRDFALHSERFVLRDPQAIELSGTAPNSREAVLKLMRQSMGRSIFQISLGERKQELEKIAWVERATVMRLWPNRLRVQVRERTPVAFVALGERVMLIDEAGVLMEMPASASGDYSFPVIVGMNENEPASTRAARMKTYMSLVRELDGPQAGGGRPQYSRNLDEVDLSDPDDVKVMARGGSGNILLHLGNDGFLPKFMVFLSNVQKWEQEPGKLESVDLRFGRQVILNPEARAAAEPEKAAPPAADKAIAAQSAPHRRAGAHRAEKKRK